MRPLIIYFGAAGQVAFLQFSKNRGKKNIQLILLIPSKISLLYHL